MLCSEATYPLSNVLFIGIDLAPEANVNLCRAVKEWCMQIDQARNSKNQNIRVFETYKEELGDVETVEAKKPKESKEDPRLAMMRRRKQEGQ
jgi:hypothetical protein